MSCASAGSHQTTGTNGAKGGLISFVSWMTGDDGSAAGHRAAAPARQHGYQERGRCLGWRCDQHEGNVVKSVFELSVGRAVKMQVDVDSWI